MGLFGLIRSPNDTAVAELGEWAGKEYFIAAAVAGASMFGEETLNTLTRSLAGLKGIYDTALKYVIRFIMSGILWYGFNKLGMETYAFASSISVMGLAVYDIIQSVLKKSPENVASWIRGRLGISRRIAYTSAGYVSVPATAGSVGHGESYEENL